MKYEQTIKNILSEFHESWMDDADKEDCDAEVIRRIGKELDAAIDEGVANGYTVEQQEKLVRGLFMAMRGKVG